MLKYVDRETERNTSNDELLENLCFEYVWFRPKMVNFVMMIGSRYLNFEDEIFLRGVECNIPPDSIGILPFDRVR
jgi:hypothetical protein